MDARKSFGYDGVQPDASVSRTPTHGNFHGEHQLMRLLCFSDLHRDAKAAEQLVERSSQADVVIGAGDFATRRMGLSDTIDVLKGIEIPTLLVPGNGESYEELEAACRDWKSSQVLHGTGCSIENQEFWGVGGGIPVTPFGDWSYDFEEAAAEEMLRDCPKMRS